MSLKKLLLFTTLFLLPSFTYAEAPEVNLEHVARRVDKATFPIRDEGPISVATIQDNLELLRYLDDPQIVNCEKKDQDCFMYLFYSHHQKSDHDECTDRNVLYPRFLTERLSLFFGFNNSDCILLRNGKLIPYRHYEELKSNFNWKYITRLETVKQMLKEYESLHELYYFESMLSIGDGRLCIVNPFVCDIFYPRSKYDCQKCYPRCRNCNHYVNS